MIKKWPSILLTLSISTIVGFNAGDEIELDTFLNARTHPNFLKNTANIITTLDRGTTGKVEDIKKFNSGSTGIKMLVTSGPYMGRTFWVYNDKDSSTIKLFDKRKRELNPNVASEFLESKGLVKAEALRDVNARLDPKDHALDETLKEIINLNEIVNQALASISADCQEDEDIVEPTWPLSIRDDPRPLNTPDFKPAREKPRAPSDGSPRCQHISEEYNVCSRDGVIEKFQLQNYGPNSIVTSNEYYINRSFEFEFPDRAASEMKLVIADSPDERTSHVTYSIMLFFPRISLPHAEKKGDEIHVTLPNNENVIFDAKTKVIKSGVLTENKMAQDPSGKAIGNPIKYNGSGVVIRASKTGDLPYGDIEKNGRQLPSTTIAIVSKKGFKDCQVPSKDIWYNESEKNNVMIKPEFTNDAGLDSFLKKKCGFSIF